MDIKKAVKRIATGAAGVALASAGCSDGSHGGSVDPPPEPLICTDRVKHGDVLHTSSHISGTLLSVEMSLGFLVANWVEVRVINPRNATVMYVGVPGGGSPPILHVTLELTDTSVTSGSFTVQGKLKDASGYGSKDTCDLARTFTFTINGGAVQLAQLGFEDMPLGARNRTTIAMVHRDGCTVELEAKTTFRGSLRLAWIVTDGELVCGDGNRARWQLPNRKGFYQAQVVADYGSEGLAFDAINLEVV